MKPYIKDYLEKYVAEFEQLNIDVKALILFGSQARGTAKVTSDVDIAVVMKDNLCHSSRGKLRCLGEDISHHIEANLFFTTQEAIDKAQHHFDTNKYIREEGVVLWQEKAI